MSVRLESRPTPPPAAAPTSTTGSGATWFALTATFLAGVAPLLLMNSTPLSGASSSAWVPAWLFSIAVGLRYAWLVAEGTRRLFELIFWLFAYVFLGLAPLVQMRSGIYPGTTPDIDVSLNLSAMLIIIVGSLAFTLGATAAGFGPRPEPVREPPTVSPQRVLLLTRLALLFAALYVGLVGLTAMFDSRAARTAAQYTVWPSAPVGAVVSALATLPLVVAFAALLILRRQRRAEGLGGPSLLLVVVLIALAVMNNPISSPRFVAGTAGLAVLVALGAIATTRRIRLFAVGLAVGLVLVFPYADIARYAGETGSGKTGGPASVLSSPDFDAFDQINNTVAYVREIEPAPGRQLLGAALFFVPRSLWSGKPEDTGVVLAEFRDYRVVNLSAPLWAEAFINGGWVGLIGFMALLGALVRRADERINRIRPRPPSPGVFAVTLPFYGIIVLRGSLLQSMAGVAVLVVCGWFVSSKRAPRTAPRPRLTSVER